MPRKGVSKNDVVLSANAIIEKGGVPTAAGIRSYLGRGSLTTIQKYFRNWKKEIFKERIKKEKGVNESQALISKDRDVKVYEKKIVSLEEQNQALSQELIKKEKENLKLNKENVELSQNLEELTQTYKSLFQKHEGLNEAYQELKKEREITHQKILEDKNTQIERLRTELREVNELHLKIIRELGQTNDEALIQEKVKNINLTDKVNELINQIKGNERDIKKTEALERELKRQQALIQKYINWEQIQAFDRGNRGLYD